MNSSRIQSWVRSVASAAPVNAASEAGAPARRKTPFIPAMAEAAESIGANPALAASLRIAASGLAVAAERLWRSFGTVVKTARGFGSIESVAGIKRPAWRVIPPVVVNRVVVIPIATPVVPAPPVAPKEPDAEATSEEE